VQFSNGMQSGWRAQEFKRCEAREVSKRFDNREGGACSAGNWRGAGRQAEAVENFACIPEVAVEAGNIMKWLREVARVLAKANRSMVWTTPAGFQSFMKPGNRKHNASPHRIVR
jgi:hypothetical protein